MTVTLKAEGRSAATAAEKEQDAGTSDTVDYMYKYRMFIKEHLHSGSRVICTPPVLDTDDDYMCLVDKDQLDKFRERLREDNFYCQGQDTYNFGANDGAKVESWKNQGAYEVITKTVTNLILTCDPDYFQQFYLATCLSRKLNLRDKRDRVTVFEALCRNVWPSIYEDVYSKAPDYPVADPQDMNQVFDQAQRAMDQAQDIRNDGWAGVGWEGRIGDGLVMLDAGQRRPGRPLQADFRVQEFFGINQIPEPALNMGGNALQNQAIWQVQWRQQNQQANQALNEMDF